MRLDSAGLQVLSHDECMHLLASCPIGRIVFTDRALPAVQPVNFCLDGTDIVIRTTVGSKLAAATRRTIVAFEVDDFDLERRTGWSVTAVGYARAVDDPQETARLAELPLTPWVPGSRDHFIVITAEQVSGRRLRQPG
ncbi:pyridoxamine 5'-phosphate oxidase family protein [Planomonospora venezuelensis]|uniref:Nitroimidazol reductase NimA-like FMN-containing flavoprotein (Pyridoxamine 5'-phosphate oxidase superfamily) n=1 Tax=Planomonospora venezuelensis TaxID=1999 RepID=A0A841DF37_PLAVE|nr:pyridoxamine 5'-phosphate oxidase family protein [Planomonospora venezuelensis]MBB5967547.1 nitroimidazol reductase NimA-like FMN-containing flavoprotein (pyridoxamine 5'-phosphate oxidase superfamily) [Planomonospora venezuelensis]GIN04784.1 pyridoxamine 5'-phosphate oxidase [Planomonospora venezuelensis]